MSTNRSMTDRIAVLYHLIRAFTTTQTPANGVDVKGLKTAEIIVEIGTITNIANSPTPSWAFALQHSDTVNSGFAAVESTDVVMPGALPLAHRASSRPSTPPPRMMRSTGSAMSAASAMSASSPPQPPRRAVRRSPSWSSASRC